MDNWSQPAGRAHVTPGQPPSGPQPPTPHQRTPYPAAPPPAATPPGATQPGATQPGGLPPGGLPPRGAPYGGPQPGWAPPSSGPPTSPAGPVPAPPQRPARRPAWPGLVALVLVVMLTAALGVQTWQVVSLSSRLDEATERLGELSQGQAYGGERLDALEERASELERHAGEVFDTEAVAAAVLPSVFMVLAGPFSGTAFAVGEAADGGGTNLFTNYHVVAEVWEEGGREVSLERTNQRYDAEIVDVNPESDVAWLSTPSSFTGLAATGEEVRAGQPVIAVGAPQGLTDTVTSGVVSTPAQRLQDGSGPWIQFDAAINPGNSGGPVINSAQEVVGIATAKGRETEGIGFAVPIDVACDLFDIC